MSADKAVAAAAAAPSFGGIGPANGLAVGQWLTRAYQHAPVRTGG